MKLHDLTVATRKPNGKGAAREARRNGTVPAILYGDGKENVAVELDQKSFETIVQGRGGEHALIQLEISDNTEQSGPVMIKAVQHHPVSDTILSVDLLRIHLDKPIETVVPIKLVGQCVGLVKGGVPDQHEHEVAIRCLPLDVPDEMIADITNLDLGHTFFVEGITPIEGIEILTPADRTVIAIKAPRVAKGSAAAIAAEADAAGEAEGGEGGEEAAGDES